MLIRLNVIDREGKKTSIDIEEGTTIRDAIDEKLSPDNYGVCGGNCACGTCHVHVASSDFEKLKAAEKDEILTLKESAIKPIALCGRIGVSSFRFIVKDMTFEPAIEERYVVFEK